MAGGNETTAVAPLGNSGHCRTVGVIGELQDLFSTVSIVFEFLSDEVFVFTDTDYIIAQYGQSRKVFDLAVANGLETEVQVMMKEECFVDKRVDLPFLAKQAANVYVACLVTLQFFW